MLQCYVAAALLEVQLRGEATQLSRNTIGIELARRLDGWAEEPRKIVAVSTIHTSCRVLSRD